MGKGEWKRLGKGEGEGGVEGKGKVWACKSEGVMLRA